MTDSCCDVDPLRLRLLLEDRLPEVERHELESHLACCDVCRTVLEKIAGDTRWWEDARRFVPGELAPSDSAETTGEDRPGAMPEDRSGSARAAAPWSEDLWLDFLAPSPDPSAIGRLGPYEVISVLGRGGMGIVLKAFDAALDRMVALKVLAPALAASGAARRRFAREARAAAAVVHEHVVAIHAVDSWRGLPYLVMQYVRGRSLQDRIDQDGPLEIEEVLRIGMQAASGLAAAHALGLVHRDVKPANILLENGVERVKLTDFGLARAADDASLTESGVLPGTPQYMAPEQAHGDGVDHRADLFSLGSVLYAMCAGRPPFRAESTVAVLRRVCDENPRPLRELNPDVPATLAALIAKLHNKDRSERFQSASEVADELGSNLARLRQPEITPRPEHTQPRARARSLAAVAAVLMLLIGLGAAGAGGIGVISSLVATVFRIQTAEGTLVVQVEDPQVKFKVDGEELVFTGTGPQEFRFRPGRHQLVATKDGMRVLDRVITIKRGDKELVTISREEANRQPRSGDDVEKVSGSPTAIAGRELPDQTVGAGRARPLAILRSTEHTAEVYELRRRVKDLEDLVAMHAASPELPPRNNRNLDAACKEATFAQGNTKCPRFSQNGLNSVAKCLACHQTWREIPHRGGKGGDSADVVKIAPREEGVASADGAERSPDPRDTVAPPGLEIGQILTPLPVGDASPASSWPHGVISSVSFSPDGTDIALACGDGSIVVCSLRAKNIKHLFMGHSERAWSVAYSPDGKTLASASGRWSPGGQGELKLWDLAKGRERAELFRHDRPVFAVAFSPDGKTLAAGGWDSTIRLWDVNSGRVRATCAGHEGTVRSIAFQLDGRALVSAGLDGTVRFWDANSGEENHGPIRTEGDPPNCVVIARDGKTFLFNTTPDPAIADRPRDDERPSDPESACEIKLWNWDSRKSVRALGRSRNRILSLAISPDGKTVAAAGGMSGHEGEVKLWDIATGKLIADLGGHDGWVECVAFAPDGRTLVSAGGFWMGPGEIKLWDLRTIPQPSTSR